MSPPLPRGVTEADVRAALGEMGAVARLTPFSEGMSWYDVLFHTAAEGAHELAGPHEPDGALLEAVAAELAGLAARRGGLVERAHAAWLERVLRLPRLAALPDQVVAHVEADPKTAPAVLPPGTLLRGGKDDFGNERRYRTLDPLTAHGAALVGVRSLVPGGHPVGRPGLAGAAPAFPLSPEEAPPAPHRMRIHSPALAFGAGEQQVTLAFIGATGVDGLARALWRWSRRDGTVAAGITAAVSGSSVTLDMSDGCGAPGAEDPWVECELPEAVGPPVGLEFTGVTVSVTRSDVVPDAGFYNDGAVDITKEFQPFGAVAKRGDAFYLRCDEAFGKVVDTLRIAVTLMAGNTPLSSSAGGSGIPLHVWEPIKQAEGAVRTTTSGSSPELTDLLRSLEQVDDPGEPRVAWERRTSGGWQPFSARSAAVASIDHDDFPGDAALSEQFALAGQPGRYVRAFLAEGDFGWSGYQAEVAAFATTAVKNPEYVDTMPTPPIPPVVSGITVDYTTTAVAATHVESRSGWRRLAKPATGSFHPFRREPSDDASGMIAVGLDLPDAAWGSSVSLWLDVDSASACRGPGDEPVPGDTVPAAWQWWDGTAWKPLAVADASRQLREPGLLRFVAPAGWAAGCPDVDSDTGRWVRLATTTPAQLGRVRGVVVDAVPAEFVSAAPEPAQDTSSATALPLGAIKGTLAPVPGVRKVTNLASTRGRGPEGDADYRARASARVRHRGRAVTPWDYEQQVLLALPEVRALRCLPHTGRAGTRSPGSVALVVVPDRPGERAPVPSVGLAEQVAATLAPAGPVGASVEVLCPLYVEVTVEATIALRRGVAALTGLEALTAALESTLHPTGDAGSVLRWGRTLYASSLISFLEGREHVDVVTSFLLRDGGGNAVEQVDVDPCRGLYCSSGDHVLTCQEQL